MATDKNISVLDDDEDEVGRTMAFFYLEMLDGGDLLSECHGLRFYTSSIKHGHRSIWLSKGALLYTSVP